MAVLGRAHYDSTRIHGFWMVSMFTKKIKRPRQLATFPWEEDNSPSKLSQEFKDWAKARVRRYRKHLDILRRATPGAAVPLKSGEVPKGLTPNKNA